MASASPDDDPTVLLLSEQIGFYFSDANLRKDKFLIERTGRRGVDGVALTTFLDFPRVKALAADVVIEVYPYNWALAAH